MSVQNIIAYLFSLQQYKSWGFAFYSSNKSDKFERRSEADVTVQMQFR